MLNETILKALQPQAKIYQAADGGGLFVRISPAGLKTFYYEFRHEGRKLRGTLGQWPAMSLQQARTAVQETKQKAVQENQTGPMELFGSVFARWFEMKSPQLRLSTYKAYKVTADLHILPALGKTPLINVTAPAVIKAFTPLHKANSPFTLIRAVNLVNMVLDWSVNAGAIPVNPCHRVAAYFTRPPVTHRATRPAADLPLIFAQTFTPGVYPVTELFILFTVCSLLRTAECARLQWDFIDQKEGVIKLPAELMKAKRPHRVPVTAFMQEILQAAQALQLQQESPYIFPSSRRGSHVSPQMACKRLRRVTDRRIVAHGFRAMGRSWMADEGVDFEVAEACLAHVTGSQTARAYQRHDFLERRRPVMEKWCSLVRAAYMDCPGVLLKRVANSMQKS